MLLIQSGRCSTDDVAMTDTPDIPWKRIAVEASAIVASILLAFGIDAWWEEQKDRAEETELLTRLMAEFSLNIERMDQVFWWAGYDASVEFYSSIDSALDREELALDIPALTLRRAMWSPTFETNTPVLDGIIRSGRLELIENEQILAELSTWERLIRDYSELAQRTRRNLDDRLIPALVVRADVGPVLVRTWGRSNFDEGAPDRNDVTMIHLDEELKGLLAVRIENDFASKNIFDQARMSAQNLVEAIRVAKFE